MNIEVLFDEFMRRQAENPEFFRTDSHQGEARDVRPKKGPLPPLLIGGTLTAPDPKWRPDYLSVTLKSNELTNSINLEWFTAVLLRRFSAFHDRIFSVILKKGRNGYESGLCFFLGADAGGIFFGGKGQRGSVLFELKGAMCALLTVEDWVWIYRVIRRFKMTITRVDLAADFFRGELCVRCLRDAARYDLRAVLTKSHTGLMPSCTWIDSGSKGATFTIGSRAGNRQIVVYEKGRKDGDVSSPWTRLEVRFLRRTQDVCAEILKPVNWLAFLRGSGDFFARLLPVGESRKLTRKSRPAEMENLLCTVIRSVNHVRSTYGRFLYWLGQMVGQENALRLLAVETGSWGKVRRFPMLATDEAETLMSLLLCDASIQKS